jgi:autotransporter translocation and assembly factor TamB
VPASDSLGPAPERPALEGTFNVSGADLEGWIPAPFDGVVQGRIDVVLGGWSARATLEASGVLTHEPSDRSGTSLLARTVRAELEVLAEGLFADTLWSDADSTRASLRLFADGPGRFAEASLAAAGGSGEWALEMDSGDGTLRGQGRVAWEDSVPSLVVDGLTASRFDGSAIYAELPETSISGFLEGRLAGATVEDASGSVALRLDSSTLAGTTLDSLRLTATIDQGTASGTFVAQDTAYRAEVAYRATVTDSLLLATVRDAHIASLASAADTAATALDVWLHGDGRWAMGAETRGQVDVVVDSARAAGALVRSGEITATLEGSRVVGDAELVLDGVLGGAITVDASLDGDGLSPTGMVGRLEATVAHARDPDSTTVATTEETGPDGEDGRTAGRQTAQVGFAPTDSVHVVLRAPQPGSYTLDGWLRPAEGGEVAFEGRGAVAEERASFDVSAGGSLDSASELLRGATIDSVAARASGTRIAGDWSGLDASMLLTGGAWRDVAVDSVWVAARTDSAGLRVDTVRVASNVLLLAGSGFLPDTAPASGTVELTGELRDVEPVRMVAGAEVLGAERGDLHLTATGALDSLTVESSLELQTIAWRQVRVSDLNATARATLDREPDDATPTLVSGSLAVALDRMAFQDADIRSIEIDASGGRDSIIVEASAIVDDERTGDLLVRVDPRPEYRTARIERLDFQLDEDEWQIVEPAVVSYGSGVSIDSFAMAAQESRIAIDGGVGAEGALDVAVAVDSTDIGTVSDLLGLRGLDGWLGGEVRLRGTTSAPEGTVDLRGAFRRIDGRMGPASIEITADGARATTDIDLEDDEGGRLTVDGSLPIPTANDAADTLGLTVVADAFRVAWALPFLDPGLVASLGGQIDGEVDVRGTFADPALDGRFVVSSASARIPTLGVRFRDIAVVATAQDSRIVIDSAHVATSSGIMTGHGTVTLADSIPLDLVLTLDDFLPIANDQYRATLSGTLLVEGELFSPVVDGDIDVQSLDVYLNEQIGAAGLEEVELTEEDLAMLRDRFGYLPERESADAPISERLTADIEVDLGRDSWLRKESSPEMAVAFTGSVTAQLRPGQEPVLDGSVEVIENRGFIEQFGRRFQPGEGTVTFAGPVEETRVDLAATYSVPSYGDPDNAEATIILNVQGTQDSLSIELSSEPPMENADIVSYIATGRPAAGSLSFGGNGSDGGLMSAGANLALDQVLGAVEGAAEQSVGLDVVEIRREGLREATLVAGKYVSPRLYVGFSQPVSLEGGGLALGGEGASEVELELQALRWLLLNIEGSDSALSFFLRGRYAY